MDKQFTEEMIREIYEKLAGKVKANGVLTVLERKLGPAAGHALDALEMSKDLGCPLDLAELSQDAVNIAVLTMFNYYEKEGHPAAACRAEVAKKIGGYLLFAVCNECNRRDGVDAAPVTKGSDLMVEVLAADGDVLSRIEVFSPAERFISEELRYDKEAGQMILRDPERLFRVLADQMP